MTKAELRQLIIEKLSGGDTTTASRSKYHPVVVDKTIEAGYNDIVRAILDSAKKSRTKVDIDHLVRPYYLTPKLFALFIGWLTCLTNSLSKLNEL